MSLLEAARKLHQPSTWDDMPPGTEVALFKLTEGSREYKSVISKVDLRFKCSSGPEKVVRVQNPYLWGCYLLRKAECIERSRYPVTEKVLFHATRQSNIDSITENNLDWRRSIRTKYGCGVSFSPSATYANTWCNRNIGSSRALFVTRVLVGRSHGGVYCTELPNEGYDTTDGNYEQVYVKYYDHEFYPEYVIYYSNNVVR
jgi:hypothetical protein